MTMFIVGPASRIGTTERAPLVTTLPGNKHQTAFLNAPNSSKYMFRVVRRQLADFKGLASGEIVYVRVLPEDAGLTLADIDAQIADAELTLARVREERRAFLAGVVSRAAKVKV